MSEPKLSDYNRAKKLLEIYRGGSDDFFKLWPKDKLFYFSDDKKAFLAYGIKRNVVICMGDPVGPKASITFLLKDFKEFCLQNKYKLAFVQTTDQYKDIYKTIGLRNILIGADAVIDLSDFTKNTLHTKYFRNLVNRYAKHQFEFKKYKPPHSDKLLDELKDVSDSWLKLPQRKEWSFLTGRFSFDYLQQVNLYVLRDSEGKAQAFTTELPSFQPGVFTIDLMRHRTDAPTNSIDMLFIQLLQTKETEGYATFNLGMSPLDGRPFTKSFADKILHRTYKISNNFIGFKGLHQFKAKYQPKWEPRYVWYQDGRRNLLPIAAAVTKLLKGS